MGYLSPRNEDGSVSARRPIVFPEKGRTKQGFKTECDVNHIMEKYQKTGIVTHLASQMPQFLDVSEVEDYHSALEQVRIAQEFFMSLPSSVRSEFENDPAKLLDAFGDPSQHAKLAELGFDGFEPADSGEPATPVVAEPPQPESEPPAAPEGPSDG